MSTKKATVLIAGQLASGTTEIAQLVGSSTGLPVENTESFFREIAVEFQESFQYLEHISKSGEVDLEKVLEGMAKDRIAKGNVIIEGRSALLTIDSDVTLKVFLHKDLADRKKFLMARREVNEEEALKELAASDQEREHYFRMRLNADWKSSEFYDLTINTSKVDHQQAAQLIESALKVTGR
jgi:cytidylate kinase